MATEVIMPKVDMDQENGTLVEWIKQEGEQVRQNEPLFIMETDKVAIEVESPGTGILRGVTVKPGDTVTIGSVIAYLLDPGESLSGEMPVVGTTNALPQAAPASIPNGPGATPVARNMAAKSGLDLMHITGSGPGGKVTKSDVNELLTASSKVEVTGSAIHATPAARRIGRESGVNLQRVMGSGPGGRIQAADVAAMAAQLVPVSQSAAMSPDVEVVPLVGIRRTIADRMTTSYRTVPHIDFTVRVDMTAVNQARERMNSLTEVTGGVHISLTAMIVKVVALKLVKHPYLNASLHREEIHLQQTINIGIAVALEEGLIVPVIRSADRKAIGEIAAEVNDLSTRAREGRLAPSEVRGGTFTISNLGRFGIEQFTAIINPPESAILAIGSTQMEAIPLEGGQIVARPIMRITLSADHRIVDGAVAARFISELKRMLETLGSLA